MNIEQINASIIAGKFTNDELRSITEAVHFARNRLARSVKSKLSIGDNVNFTNSKTGQNYTGHVTKIAVKNVTVRTVEGLWRVPAAMLTVVNA
jgi:hypothetical protein